MFINECFDGKLAFNTFVSFSIAFNSSVRAEETDI